MSTPAYLTFLIKKKLNPLIFTESPGLALSLEIPEIVGAGATIGNENVVSPCVVT